MSLTVLSDVIDYSPLLEDIFRKVNEVAKDTAALEDILAFTNLIADASVWIQGFLLFFVVVVLCYFVYKFFRIFI